MNIKSKLIAIALCTANLSSCMMEENGVNSRYASYYIDDTNNNLYSPENYQMSQYGYQVRARKEVTVPDSYHVGEFHSPVSFKDRDRDWVSSQNPQGYTIEVADDEKAAAVAQKLYKVPKTNRMAEVRYQRDGKSYYKGLFGTYNSFEEAQKALDALPSEIKQGAGIKNWSNVQNNLND